jgi:hypothetical protein
MITMSSDAMPLSLLPLACLKLRRIIGLALAVPLVLALGGCGMLRLAYDQAPMLLYWWIDGYADVSGEQTPKLREGIDRWFVWHRRTQLPDYAALLVRAQREVLEPTTAAAACSWQSEIEQRIELAATEVVPAAAELMLSLSPEQLLHIERRMVKGLAEARADFLQADLAERKASSLKRSVGRFENLYGRLESAQRERLATALASSNFDPERWLAERELRQRDMLRTLTTVSALGRAGGDREAARQQAQAAARAITERMTQSPRADYRAYQQRLRQDNCQLAASLHNATTPAQRQVARAKLKGWETDVRALITSAAGIDNGAVSR